MTATIPIVTLSDNTQEALIQYVKSIFQDKNSIYSIRNTLEEADRSYYREGDNTEEHVKARMANSLGDTSKVQNITVPVVMPQVEAFVSYQTSVFLTGTPLFGVVASPKYEDAAIQLEAIISDQALIGKWRSELIKFFRDCGKYGIGACEIPWEKVVVPTFETDVNFSISEAKPVQTLWEGNKIKKLDLYNSFWDTRVAPSNVAEFGEFAGYTEVMSRTRLKQLIAALEGQTIVQNIKPAFESGFESACYYIPQLNPSALIALSANNSYMHSTDWMTYAGIANGRNDIAYKGVYGVTTVYIRLLPSEFSIKVPQPNTPQVWKFIIVNNKHIIYA